MSEVLALLMIVAAVIFVAVPFFRAREGSSTSSPRTSERMRLERQKLEAYAAIKEVELDYHMGKLSDGDFAVQREKQAKRALEAIAAMHAAPGEEARRFCSDCGSSLPTRAKFCGACGSPVKMRAA